MAESITPGFSNVMIDAHDWALAAIAFGILFDEEAAREIERAMRDSAGVVQRAVIKRAKRHRRTGKLESKVRIREVGIGWENIQRVKSEGSVAHLIAGGTRAHDIPLRSHASKSMPIYEGRAIKGYARGIARHPGVRKDPYFHVGAMNSRLAINAILKASAKRLTVHLAAVISKGTP